MVGEESLISSTRVTAQCIGRTTRAYRRSEMRERISRYIISKKGSGFIVKPQVC